MRLVLAGFGVVGQSFAELLAHKQKELASVYGLVPRVVAIVDSTGSVTDEHGLDVASTRLAVQAMLDEQPAPLRVS